MVDLVNLFAWLETEPFCIFEHFLQILQFENRTVDEGISAMLRVIFNLLRITDVYFRQIVFEYFGLDVHFSGL